MNTGAAEPPLPEPTRGEATLRVEGLSIGFGSGVKPLSITDGVSFDLRPGEIYGLVGESGCGKTVTALALMRLLPEPGGRVLGGRVWFRGRDILTLSDPELQRLRGKDLAMIFQEPSAALNPLVTVEKQLLEVFDYHPFQGDPSARVRELLVEVGIADPDRILGVYPHELSGGMLQRVMIAMALLLDPDVLIADEPTTALDVTVQAQIMELLLELQRRQGTTILLITHNMGLIAQYAHRVGVMYAGRLVEESSVDSFLDRPLHPYSRGLLAAIPDLESPSPSVQPIPGQVPRAEDFPEGCRFKDRCPDAFEACQARPVFAFQGEARVACFLYPQAGNS